MLYSVSKDMHMREFKSLLYLFRMDNHFVLLLQFFPIKEHITYMPLYIYPFPQLSVLCFLDTRRRGRELATPRNVKVDLDVVRHRVPKWGCFGDGELQLLSFRAS